MSALLRTQVKFLYQKPKKEHLTEGADPNKAVPHYSVTLSASWPLSRLLSGYGANRRVTPNVSLENRLLSRKWGGGVRSLPPYRYGLSDGDDPRAPREFGCPRAFVGLTTAAMMGGVRDSLSGNPVKGAAARPLWQRDYDETGALVWR